MSAPKSKGEEEPSDANIPDNYVSYTLKHQKALDPISWDNWWQELNLLHAAILGLTPIMGIIGAFVVRLRWETAVWSVVYYFMTGLGITAGYHRLWAHRSYNASKPLQFLLCILGAGAVQGSIRWWARGHRAHHRYTDTDLDPYNAHKGLLWSHIGWMLFKPRRKPGVADISDLAKNEVVRWQHRHYLFLVFGMGYIFPMVVAGLGWGDWKGGYVYASLLRLCFVHHSTFCVNSLAHYLGDAPFDDKHTPRDHLITALCTIGEGYHNFHHQFPMDYRNAIKWYQYDPTKWTIWFTSKLGLSSHLKVFPENEVRKGQLTMQLKRLREIQEKLNWPSDNSHLPVISWESFLQQAQSRPLICIAGFIHDVDDFLDQHPGGRHLLTKYIGRDATTAFFGGVYDHSNAAHNLLSMKRVGVLLGGAPHGLEDKAIPPSQRLRIAHYNEMGGSGYSSAALSDSEGLLG
ncbi:delta 9-fatty acid desaturase protein [Coniophora puteana RWD-64-598 SS2]|uniref:Acyl-CoA desaturase n=1 Tax=Coniophora puteana (strain RWD-64-598) TaxID=741705 RepID=A0A5M3MD98_CONPW|nr:delta 9-fatty acid desaturase protein [Coniophora puteana RWD-64-598 SS2]EIW77198.1 delta 9-fatty acid desaturase protein [Coniophora puteana RWD-64-598 SS2]